MGSQAEGLLCKSRGQVRLRRTPPPVGAATEPPDPEGVVYSLRRARPGAYTTPTGSNGTGVEVNVGGVPPWRALPAATVGQPFRLYQRTALKPPEVARTPFELIGLTIRARKSTNNYERVERLEWYEEVW